MGHIRLGRLPQTRRWLEVINLLADSPGETALLGASITQAAQTRFIQLAKEQTLSYPVWLMTRVVWAARGTRFISELGEIGIRANSSSTAFDLISATVDRVKRQASEDAPAGHLTELAAQALRSALTATVATRGKSLLDSELQDAQRAFRDFSTEARFGELARRFFANFMSRTLISILDRELPKHVGSAATPTSADARAFKQALETHTWETSAILERYAGEWYSKYNWQTGGEITQDEAQRFTARGLQKLRAEFRSRAEPR